MSKLKLENVKIGFEELEFLVFESSYPMLTYKAVGLKQDLLILK